MSKHYKISKLATNFQKLAFQALKTVLRRVNVPLIILKQGDFVTIIPIRETETLFVPTGMVSLDVPSLQMNPEFNPNEWRRIAAIWADDSWTAIYLLGAALYFASKIVTDHSVTPAAQAVMRRIYERNKDNPNLIVQNVIASNEQTAYKPWMTAGYLNNGEGDQQYAAAIQAGEELKQIMPERQLIEVVQGKWEAASADAARTGENKGEKIEQEPIQNVPEMR